MTSPLLRSMSWLTIVFGIERVAGLVQTVLIARALGITDYGIYGLLFGTIGLVASLAALQMGMTATVFVARYKEHEKAKAAFVITFVRRFGFAMALGFLACTLPFARYIGDWLVGPTTPVAAVIAGCVMVGASLISGMQDGIVEGFEDFRAVAISRAVVSFITVSAIYPAAVAFGLVGAMCVVLGGVAIKYAYVSRVVARHVLANRLPARGTGLRAIDLIWSFGLPSMLVSLLVGVVGWIGSVVISHEPKGFDSLAVVNTGLQWRGPILLLASVVGTVAIPAISRHVQSGDHAAIRVLKRHMLLYTGGLALALAIVLAAGAPILLAIYGREFRGGHLVFAILVLSTAPQVVAGVYCQHFLAKAQVWRMLGLHLWLVIPMAGSYVLLIPRFHSLGFAIANVIGWCVFAAALGLRREDNAEVETITPSELAIDPRGTESAI